MIGSDVGRVVIVTHTETVSSLRARSSAVFSALPSGTALLHGLPTDPRDCLLFPWVALLARLLPAHLPSSVDR